MGKFSQSTSRGSFICRASSFTSNMMSLRTIYARVDYVSNTFAVFDCPFLIYYLGVGLRAGDFRPAALDGLACHRSRKVRMLSRCLASGSVRRASCVRTFVRPNTLTFVPGVSTFPTFMSRYSPRPFLDNKKSRSAAAAPTRRSSTWWQDRGANFFEHVYAMGSRLPRWNLCPFVAIFSVTTCWNSFP